MAPPSTPKDPWWLLGFSASLLIESPHLELNGANLIAVITMMGDALFLHAWKECTLSSGFSNTPISGLDCNMVISQFELEEKK